jgi:hypothetical protein
MTNQKKEVPEFSPLSPAASTLPPSFPVETKTETAEEYIRRLTTPIFNKVLQETNKNPVMVGGGVPVPPKICFYKPHNLRLYFDYNFKGFYTPPYPALPRGTQYKLQNHNSEHSFRGFFDCNIIIRKESIEVYNNINPIWYPLTINNQVREQIEDIISEKIEESKKVLQEFIKLCGGSSKLQVLRLSSEDKIQGEDYIDKLPLNLRFRNRVGKKEYHEKNFEFDNHALASNYLESAATVQLAPVIAKEIANITDRQIAKDTQLAIVQYPLRYLKLNCFSLSDILANKQILLALSAQERLNFSNWTFERFGVHI